MVSCPDPNPNLLTGLLLLLLLVVQVLPKEKMDSACGTLSYVAPEVSIQSRALRTHSNPVAARCAVTAYCCQVLTMQGYGKEADLWSVGVIMFLLLCGKLPFDGEDHNEIIRSTIQVSRQTRVGLGLG